MIPAFMPLAGFSPSCWAVLVHTEHWPTACCAPSVKKTSNKRINIFRFMSYYSSDCKFTVCFADILIWNKAVFQAEHRNKRKMVIVNAAESRKAVKKLLKDFKIMRFYWRIGTDRTKILMQELPLKEGWVGGRFIEWMVKSLKEKRRKREEADKLVFP